MFETARHICGNCQAVKGQGCARRTPQDLGRGVVMEIPADFRAGRSLMILGGCRRFSGPGWRRRSPKGIDEETQQVQVR